jgi:uncharacterized protein
MFHRRTLLQWTAAAIAAQATGGLRLPAAETKKKILFFTKSSGFQHSVVTREGDSPAFAERIFADFASKAGFDVVVSKDGTLFDGDLAAFDAFFFYTTGNLMEPGTDMQPPMSEKGKAHLLEAIHSGKGFLGSHCASDTFHSGDKVDPYIEMIGGEFISHGEQQVAKMTVVNAGFPGFDELGKQFEMHEEWYSLKNINPEMHVLLVQETEGMKNDDYKRPKYPATWARMHGEGRVFYTSMGHREDVWQSEKFQAVLLGALAWATRLIDADVPTNFADVTPDGNSLSG